MNDDTDGDFITGLHWVGVLWIAAVTFAYGVSLMVGMI